MSDPGGTENSTDLAHGYTRTQRLIELSGITVYFTAMAISLIRLFMLETPENDTALLVIGGLFGGFMFADASSGLVHWMADNWGKPSWPLVGSGFIRPFRHHHVDPLELTRHGFVELNGNNCIVALPVVWGSLHSCGSHVCTLFWSTFWFSVGFWVLMTNQAHAWAHLEDRPWYVRFLQRTGFCLSPEYHDKHHVAPHNTNYCITHGWSEIALRLFRVFPILEWSITAVTGVLPVHKQITPESDSPDLVKGPLQVEQRKRHPAVP